MMRPRRACAPCLIAFRSAPGFAAFVLATARAPSSAPGNLSPATSPRRLPAAPRPERRSHAACRVSSHIPRCHWHARSILVAPRSRPRAPASGLSASIPGPPFPAVADRHRPPPLGQPRPLSDCPALTGRCVAGAPRGPTAPRGSGRLSCGLSRALHSARRLSVAPMAPCDVSWLQLGRRFSGLAR